jgi:hypothetical protein
MDRVEATLQTIVDHLKGGRDQAHGAAADATEARLSASSTVADEVAAELARRDQAAKDAEREAMIGRHDQEIAKLTEKRPETPVRRIEGIMGWRG